MLADLDLLLIAVFCAADDLLPKARNNARRIVTDAEVVTLCVAQAIMGIPSDPRFLAVARKRLIHLFPVLPDRAGFYKRREALSDTIEALIAEFAARSPGSEDDVLLVDSTPVECARSRETVKRGGSSSLDDALANAADYGYCASHSRYFYGFRLHTLFALDGTPRAVALTSAKVDEKEVCLQLVARCRRQPGQFLTLIGDKNFRGKEFETKLAALNATILRPQRKDERNPATTTEPSSSTPALRPASHITPQPRPTNPQPRHPHLAPIRQRVESIYWTAKDILTLERHGARTLHSLRTRIACRLLALAAAIQLNHQLGLPSRALAQYTA
jgi:Transposase DDE domain